MEANTFAMTTTNLWLFEFLLFRDFSTLSTEYWVVNNKIGWEEFSLRNGSNVQSSKEHGKTNNKRHIPNKILIRNNRNLLLLFSIFMCNLLTAANENGNLFDWAISPLRLSSGIGIFIFRILQNCWSKNMNHKKSNGHSFHVKNIQ